MPSTKTLLTCLALAVTAIAMPIVSRDDYALDDLNDCATAFSAAFNNLASACPILTSNNAQLMDIGQQSCVNASSVFLAVVQPNCTTSGSSNGRRGASGGIEQATACNSTVSSAFSSFVTACDATFDDNNTIFIPALSAACTAAEQAALSSMSSACPPTDADANDANALLAAASSAGGFAQDIDAAAGTLASKIAQAKAAGGPSTDACTQSLSAAVPDLTDVCTIAPPQPALAALAQQACDANAAVLGIVTPACGSVAAAQNEDGDAFAAGAGQAQGLSCHDAQQSAFNAIENDCPSTAGCRTAQITALGILSAACPAAK